MMSLDPDSWKVPKWHKDFGNPEVELEHLKKFCAALLADTSSFDLSLDCYEEGYMCVEVIANNKKLGELHWLEDSDFKYGFFTDDDEFKFHSIQDGVDFLINQNARFL